MLTSRKKYSNSSLRAMKNQLLKASSEKILSNPIKLNKNLKPSLVSLISPKDSSNNQIQLSGSNKSVRVRGSVSKSSLLSKFSPSKIFPHIKNSEVDPTFLKEMADYEKEESKGYKIYFAGCLKNKLKLNPDDKNNGLDFETGFYKLIKGDHIGYRYEIIDCIGKGSFGVVCECYDHKNKEHVALKILRNKKSYNKQGGVEISILKALKDNDKEDTQNVIKLKNHFIFRNHICLVFDLLSISLYHYMSLAGSQGLPIKQVVLYTLQVLQGLCYLESLSIIHCDIKPENLLLTSSSCKALKIIDFGSSCFNFETIHTYIQSRYYRSPEVLLGIPYTCAIDMWSLGCLVAELYTGKVLFNGENEVEQLMLLIELIGLPPSYIIQKSSKKSNFFNENNEFKFRIFSSMKELVPKSRKIVWKDELLWEFVKKCLVWDPHLRLTPSQAMLLPVFKSKIEINSKSLNSKSLKSKLKVKKTKNFIDN